MRKGERGRMGEGDGGKIGRVTGQGDRRGWQGEDGGV